MRVILSYLFIVTLLVSCIPSRQFDDVKSAKDRCEKELAELKAKQETFSAREKELDVKLADLTKQINKLKNDYREVQGNITDKKSAINETKGCSIPTCP
jgi:chemotaxis protein MotB